MLGSEYDRARRNRILRVARTLGRGEHRAAVAVVALAQRHQDAFVAQKFVEVVAREIGEERSTVAHRIAHARRILHVRALFQFFVAETFPHRRLAERQFLQRVDQHDLALQLAAELFEIRFLLQHRDDGVALRHAVGALAPRHRISDQRRVGRRQHVAFIPGEVPTAAERLERFQAHIDKSILFELFHRPLGCRAMAGRVGQAGTVDISHVKHVIHDLGIFKGLVLDFVNDPQVDRFLRSGEHAAGRERGQNSKEHNSGIPQVIHYRRWRFAGSYAISCKESTLEANDDFRRGRGRARRRPVQVWPDAAFDSDSCLQRANRCRTLIGDRAPGAASGKHGPGTDHRR